MNTPSAYRQKRTTPCTDCGKDIEEFGRRAAPAGMGEVMPLRSMKGIHPPENVMDLGECCQCGMCESVCHHVRMARISTRENQDFWPLVDNRDLCLSCASKPCLDCCPVVGKEADLAAWLGPQPSEALNFGPIRKILIGHARDAAITHQASSGGVVTGVIQFMLAQQLATGAIVVVPNGADPMGGEFTVIRRPDELLPSCSSRYSPVPLGRVLSPVWHMETDDRLILVGRPCQIRAFLKIQSLKPRLREQVVLTISLFCAWLISSRGVEFLSALSGVREPGAIQGVGYRHGTWPGNLVFATPEGAKQFPLSPAGHTYGTHYYPLVTPFIPDTCRRCFDVLGNCADIAAGDPWNLGLRAQNGHGHTLLVVRTEAGLNVVGDPRFQAHVSISHQIDHSQLAQSQANTIRLKQAGVLADPFRPPPGDRHLRRYHAINKLFTRLVTHVPLKFLPTIFFKSYLRMIWFMAEKRVDKDNFIAPAEKRRPVADPTKTG